jgi:hypothetical protein
MGLTASDAGAFSWLREHSLPVRAGPSNEATLSHSPGP